MKAGILAAFVLLVTVAAGFAEPPALARRRVGDWKGRIACDGTLHLRADGTYALKAYGPAPYDSAGVWKLRGDAVPATLVLTCKSSEVEDEVGKSMQFKLVKLDNANLDIEYDSQLVGHYTRMTK